MVAHLIDTYVPHPAGRQWGAVTKKNFDFALSMNVKTCLVPRPCCFFGRPGIMWPCAWLLELPNQRK
eukprot:g19127.t1